MVAPGQGDRAASGRLGARLGSSIPRPPASAAGARPAFVQAAPSGHRGRAHRAPSPAPPLRSERCRHRPSRARRAHARCIRRRLHMLCSSIGEAVVPAHGARPHLDPVEHPHPAAVAHEAPAIGPAPALAPHDLGQARPLRTSGSRPRSIQRQRPAVVELHPQVDVPRPADDDASHASRPWRGAARCGGRHSSLARRTKGYMAAPPSAACQPRPSVKPDLAASGACHARPLRLRC